MTDHAGRLLNPERTTRDVIAIGASRGGIQAIKKLLTKFPGDLLAIVGIVVHRGDYSPANWAHLFSRAALQVVEPRHGEVLRHGMSYLAPSDRHMAFVDGRAELDQGPKQNFTRPAVDCLFASAVKTYGRRLVGVVLTGGGLDGFSGLTSITRAGGISLVQRLSEAERSEMPKNAIRHDHVAGALSLADIG